MTVPVPCVAPTTPTGKLEAIVELMEYVLEDRLSILRDEAETISNDMQALATRLTLQGHEAELTDIRSARWYRTAAQISCLRKLYQAVCGICEVKPSVVFSRAEDNGETTRITGTVDAVVDEGE